MIYQRQYQYTKKTLVDLVTAFSFTHYCQNGHLQAIFYIRYCIILVKVVCMKFYLDEHTAIT